MVLQALAFYLFASITVFAAIMVITARNPVNSVLFLILAFFNAAGLFVLQGAEFVAMILIIVYVGAVAVLFLFVVMMLNINVDKIYAGRSSYVWVGLIVGLILLAELALIVGGWAFAPGSAAVIQNPAPPTAEISNTRALGQLLYTKYIYLFQASGIILLIAMIGAIVLTLRNRPGVKRQSVDEQIHRDRETSVEIKKVAPGQGI